MNKFVVIIPYFGEFKASITLFLESCNRNPGIDWLIFTDCKVPEGVCLGGNILWKQMNLSDVKQLAEQKLQCEVTLNRAYKLCDMKPMYGLIFEEYIKEYEYWGFGDTDVIYGDVLSYLKRLEYERYDKINWMGHLCFIRNLPEINTIAMEEIPGTISPKTVLKTESNQGYDERDFNKKCLSRGIRLYNGEWAADIDVFYWRMRCVDLKTLHWLLDTNDVKYAPKNYPLQLFAVVDGRVFRIYIKGNSIYKDEFAYIHFRKEVPIKFEDITRRSYIISRDGFFSIDESELEKQSNVRSLIKKYNSQEGPIKEFKTFFYQYYRKKSGKRGW
ncbi:MAG: hypothetical protein IJI44_04420 [Erysipelotrichaceae bacterium]|nr:hypothetical protein [Erysipelotrichaceae bacterium]